MTVEKRQNFPTQKSKSSKISKSYKCIKIIVRTEKVLSFSLLWLSIIYEKHLEITPQDCWLLWFKQPLCKLLSSLHFFILLFPAVFHNSGIIHTKETLVSRKSPHTTFQINPFWTFYKFCCKYILPTWE